MRQSCSWTLRLPLAGAMCLAYAAGTAASGHEAERFDIGRRPAAGAHAYHAETRLVTYSEDGAQQSAERYALDLICRSDDPSRLEGGSCRCAKLTFQPDGAAEIHVPALTGVSYPFAPRERWYDDQGQAFGIPHAAFERLTAGDGQELAPETAYQIYSLFLYFHDFGHGLSAGVADRNLTRVGQSAVLEPQERETSLAFGSLFTNDSTFKSDDMYVELKGATSLESTRAVILGFESGGWLRMTSVPAPGTTVIARGRSRFHGDVLVDPKTLWPLRVRMGLADSVKVTMGEQEIGRFLIDTTLTVIETTESEARSR